MTFDNVSSCTKLKETLAEIQTKTMVSSYYIVKREKEIKYYIQWVIV